MTVSSRRPRTPRTERVDGYAPIRAYGAIGDGAMVALVALDGSIDWACLPRHDSGCCLFARLLDADRGGAFELAPDEPYTVTRRYLPESNVLETTMSCASGVVRLTDAITLQQGAELPWRELVRRVEGLSGSVPMRWTVGPGALVHARDWRRGDGAPVLELDGSRLAALAWEAGEPEARGAKLEGRFRTEPGSRGLLALVLADGPLPLPERDEIEQRLDATAAAWGRWVRSHTYDGPWHDDVVRSLLALKLLISSSTGAIIAAPTTSLPERIGGDRNWDYRYAWVRDACFTMTALIRVGFREQAHASFTWLLDTLRTTHPEVRPIYRLDGSLLDGEEELDLAGYLGSRPVRAGNRAAAQLQLEGYGDLLDTAYAYVQEGNVIDPESGRRLAEIADHVCRIWRRPDSGIWELPDVRHYTQSKIGCWIALERALDLAEAGQIPAERVGSWRRTAAAVVEYVERRCWSDGRQSYVQFPGSDRLDASQLIGVRRGYAEVGGERLVKTIDAVRRELSRGPLLYRYSGMEDEEGAFVVCSFWLVEALARTGRLDEACGLMDETIALGNDLGLFSEEIQPATGEFLGNFPQGLSHLGLVMAAMCIVDESRKA